MTEALGERALEVRVLGRQGLVASQQIAKAQSPVQLGSIIDEV